MKHSEPNRADTESQKAIDPLRHQRVFNSLLLPPGCTNWEPRGRAACNKVECTSINCDKFLCHTRADVEDEPTARGGGDVQWEWAAVRRLWSIKSISSTDWMSWGISYARTARGRQVKEATRHEVEAEEDGKGVEQQQSMQKFLARRPQKPLDVVCVGKTCGTKLSNKAKTLAALLCSFIVLKLLLLLHVVVAASFNSQHTILAFAIICVYNSHLANGQRPRTSCLASPLLPACLSPSSATRSLCAFFKAIAASNYSTLSLNSLPRQSGKSP